MKHKFTIILGIVLLLTIVNVSAQQFTVTEANDFRVEWFEIRTDITEFEYVVSVQNLQDTNRDFDLSLFISESSFGLDLNEDNFKVWEWKNISHEVRVVNEVTELIEVTVQTQDGTYQNGSIKYSYPTESQLRTFRVVTFEEQFFNDWKETQNPLKTVDDKFKLSYGNINIPKFESKQKDATVNGTKFFKTLIRTTLVDKDGVFGSKGNVGFIDEISGEEYHPPFFTGFTKKNPLNLVANASAEVPAGWTFNVTGFDTATEIGAGNMQSGCQDLRVVINDTFSIPLKVVGCNTANTAIYFNFSHSIPIGQNYTDAALYYGNTSVSFGSLHNNTRTIDWDFDNDGTLDLFYNFNESSGGVGDLIVADFASEFGSLVINLTASSGSGYTSDSDCKTGQCWDLDGGLPKTLASAQNLSILENTPLTIDFWTLLDVQASNQFIGLFRGDGTSHEIAIGNSGPNFAVGVNDPIGSCLNLNAGFGFPVVLTHMRARITNTTEGGFLYFNATEIATDSSNCALGNHGDTSLGRRVAAGAERWSGNIDEVYVWLGDKGTPLFLDGQFPLQVIAAQQAANTAPSAPVLLTPTNNSIIADSTPLLTWTNSTDVDDDSIFYVVEVFNDSALTLIAFTNNSVNETTNPTSQLLPELLQGDYFWRVLASDSALNSSFSQFQFTLSTIPSVTTPVFTLVDNTVLNNLTDLNVSTIATDIQGDSMTVDILLLVNGVQKLNISTAGVANGTNTSVLFTHGNYSHFDTLLFNAYASDLTETGLPSNSTTTVINTDPTIPTIIIPESSFTQTNQSLFLTCSGSSDLDNDTLFFEFRSDLLTTPPTTLVSNSSSNTTELTNLAQGLHFWNCRVNDQVGGNSSDIAARNFTIDFSQLKTSVFTANTEGLETSTQSFTADITYNNLLLENVTANFIFNSTNFSVNDVTATNGTRLFNVSLDLPTTNQDVNKTYNWTFTNIFYNGSRDINVSDTFQFIVINTALVACDVGNSTHEIIASFPLLSEPNATGLNGSFEGTFDIFLGNLSLSSQVNIDDSDKFIFNVCAFPKGINWTANAEINYLADNFGQRQHYLRATELNGSNPINQSLFLLDEAVSTDITFEILNENDAPLADHFLEIERKDFAEDSFTLVAIGKTDSDGKTTIALQQITAFYRFKVFDGTTLLKTTSDTQIVLTEIRINILGDTEGELLKKIDNVGFSLTFNNATKQFLLTYSDPTGELERGCLRVIQFGFGSEGVIFDDCVQAASGSLSFDIPDNQSSYSASFYVDLNPTSVLETIYTDLTQSFAAQLGTEGIVIAMFMVITLALIGSWNPVVAIGLGVMAVVFTVMFGFIFLGIGGVIGLIVVAAIYAYQLRT